MGDTFRKITVRTLEAQMRDVDFVETRFTGPADLTAVGIQQPAMVSRTPIDFVFNVT
jgi:hypothetical protein